MERLSSILRSIESTEIIKPTSPTPSHLKTYNLMLIDQAKGVSTFIPLVSFYPNTDYNENHSFHDKTLDLKRSLSQTLTKYYPFAGRHAKTGAAHVDCNDDGVEFLVGSIDTTLADFLQNSQHQHLDQLFPYRQLWLSSDRETQSDQIIPLAVQINHFECGGIAVAVSLSHKLADGSSCLHFMDDWARLCSRKQENPQLLPSDPQFISHPYRNINANPISADAETKDCVTRSFMFPNTNINKLKLKLKATRIDVLSWLLYKCAVEAATKNNSGIFMPTTFYSAINIRNKMMEPLPAKSIGNYLMIMEIPTKTESEMKPESFINALQKEKMKFRGLRNIEDAYGLLPNYTSTSETGFEEQKKNEYYMFSSLCGYPVYDMDFGWGKPVKVTLGGNIKNFILLMDAPNGDGIIANVCLDKKVMAIFQSHPEMLQLIG